MTEITIRGITKTKTSNGINVDDVTIKFHATSMSAQQIERLFKTEQFLNGILGSNCRFHISAREINIGKDE